MCVCVWFCGGFLHSAKKAYSSYSRHHGGCNEKPCVCVWLWLWSSEQLLLVKNDRVCYCVGAGTLKTKNCHTVEIYQELSATSKTSIIAFQTPAEPVRQRLLRATLRSSQRASRLWWPMIRAAVTAVKIHRCVVMSLFSSLSSIFCGTFALFQGTTFTTP